MVSGRILGGASADMRTQEGSARDAASKSRRRAMPGAANAARIIPGISVSPAEDLNQNKLGSGSVAAA